MRKFQTGFTLIELVLAIVILGILAATALPKILNVDTSAKINSVNALAGAIQSAANNYNVLCAATPSCNLKNDQLHIYINNQWLWLNYGWPDAGDDIGVDEIDTTLSTSGFTISTPNIYTTVFSLSSARTPANCSVSYLQALYNVRYSPVITTITTGC
ncbi:type II secretion system protein [Methylomonas sp. AM2-LC]|uniref:type II secretion system protein n=1 Tax=Methylomonas sp. AM2-LC TaxID=3153301 RepID=UPI003267E84D